jgi:quaternary ammonium compound-resistance protein SugE
MAWTILVLAGFLEVGWAVGLKYADGFTRVVPSVLTIASMIASIVLLGVAMKSIPLGTAYAVWTGIGTVGALIAGMILFGDSTSLVRLLCAGLIVAGIAGLKLSAA